VADNQGLLQVSSEQEEELERLAQSRALPAGDVFRARLVLRLADGLSYRKIERKLGASAPTVSKWKNRFEQAGMAGLQAAPGQPATHGHPGCAGQYPPSRTAKALRRQHALDLPQTGRGVGRQQIHGAEGTDASQVAASPAGSLNGQR